MFQANVSGRQLVLWHHPHQDACLTINLLSQLTLSLHLQDVVISRNSSLVTEKEAGMRRRLTASVCLKVTGGSASDIRSQTQYSMVASQCEA